MSTLSARAALVAMILSCVGSENLLAEQGEVKPEADGASSGTEKVAAAGTPAKPNATETAPQPNAADKKPDAARDSANAAAEKTGPAAGHSMHGEVFNEGPRQRAYLMGGTSNVHFPVTTPVPLAQKFFDQGVGQLHGFWYFEAERSFRQVAALDPDCAMAYWGMAMANANNDKRAKSFIKKAQEKNGNASPREVAWIEALAATYEGKDTIERRTKYVRDLEALVHADPNDVEAKAFLALQIWKNGSWMTAKEKQLPIVSHQAVDSILDQVFAANPMHPAHHYRIHLWDREKPARALVSASLGGQSTPAIAHMWHMPGHIYSRLHRYADGAWQQEASARVDHAHMMRDRVMPDQIHNYAHNNEWLIRNLAFLGRVDDAMALAKNMIELPRHPQYNTAEKRGGSAHYGLMRLSGVLEQYERWQEIVDYAGTQYLPAADESDLDATLAHHRLMGRAWLGLGDVEKAGEQIAAIEALLKKQRAARYASADRAEEKARKEKKSDKEVAKAMADALAAAGAKLKKFEPVLAELRGYAALAADKPEDAKKQFAKIGDDGPIRKDHLARAFSLAGDHEKAETIARKSVDDGPNEVYPLAVLVDILQRAGKRQEAQEQFAKLRTMAADADLDNRVFERLQPIAAELDLPTHWSIPRKLSLDVGQRPDLASLGPFRWEPTPATSWTLAGADGKPVSLDQYRGRPVVVIFYLGSGCLHCVEQLQKFAPMAPQFADAGISIVAISSEPLDTLAASLDKLSPNEPVPFPLAADPELVVFKDYRAYDDFEKMALHGTFLIDAEALVRWQDISYEPFLKPQFLLEEAARLLGQE